ncbi:trigger factor [Candidatus Poriferisocius sp.]|uniref:trigger factor n=1 Tax=Candidatus Poriferisocius sp. TaxID=3101276 RepID=UPI003B02C36C
MRSTVEVLEDNRVKLSVDIDPEEFEEKLDEAFRKLARQVRLPGFRPGKAPRRVLEARLGPQAARGEALSDAVPEYYAQAVNDHDVDVIAPPEIDITSGAEEGSVSFDAVVEVRPLISVTGYDQLKAEVPSPEPTEEEIGQQVDQLRKQFGELAPISRPAIDGDHVTMDIYGSYNGEEVEGLTVDDYAYEVGQGAVVPEIDEQLRGSKAGDILEFNAEHPDPDEDGLLRFRILVKEVQETVLPDFDDEFAQEASEFDTVNELRADISENIARVKRANALSSLAGQVGEQLAELVADDIPEALVDAEVQHRLRTLQMRLGSQGIEFDTYLEAIGQTADDLAESLREPALQEAKADLALRAVAAAESIVATDEDVDLELAALAAQVGQTVDEVRSALFADDETRLKGVRLDAQMRKTREWVLERVEIKDSDGNPIERSSLNPDDESDLPPNTIESQTT